MNELLERVKGNFDIKDENKNETIVDYGFLKEPPTISSMKVSEMINVDHRKLLRSIEGDNDRGGYINKLIAANLNPDDYFKKSTYVDEKNETRPCYLITKYGCDFICNKIESSKALKFSAEYVVYFNNMEDNYSTTLIAQQMMEERELIIKNSGICRKFIPDYVLYTIINKTYEETVILIEQLMVDAMQHSHIVPVGHLVLQIPVPIYLQYKYGETAYALSDDGITQLLLKLKVSSNDTENIHYQLMVKKIESINHAKTALLNIASVEIAPQLDMEHYRLLTKIKSLRSDLKKAGFDPDDYFVKSTYSDLQGKDRPMYLLTKIGCDFLCNKFRGDKGARFTAVYVNYYDELEKRNAIKYQLIEEFNEALENLQERLNRLAEFVNINNWQVKLIEDKITEKVHKLNQENKVISSDGVKHRISDYTIRSSITKQFKVYSINDILVSNLKDVYDFIDKWDIELLAEKKSEEAPKKEVETKEDKK